MDLRDLGVIQETLLPVSTWPLVGLVLVTGLVTVVVTVVAGKVAQSIVRATPPDSTVTTLFGIRGVRSVTVSRGGTGGAASEKSRPIGIGFEEYLVEDKAELMKAARAYCIGFGVPLYSAEDVLQEASFGLSLAWRRQPWQTRQQLDGYMRRIIRNKAWKFRRQRRGTGRLDASALSLDDTRLETRPDPAGDPAVSPLLKNLHQALDKLSPRLREVVILADLLGCSYSDISVQLRISESAARKARSRGVEKLGEHLLGGTDD